MEDRLIKVEEKIDKIHEIAIRNNEESKATTKQLKQVNGTIADLKKKDQDHDNSFGKVYEDLKTEAIEREKIKGTFKLYVGIAIGVSAGITLIGAILPIFL